MNSGKSVFLVIGLIWSFWFIWNFLVSGSPLYLFVSTLGITYALISIFKIKNYDNLMFYMAFLCIIVFQGLILSYTYLFEPIYAKNILYYALIPIFLIYLFYFIYYFPKRNKYTTIPW
jgi:NhaP-type Na+/H+ or K+/H+ antiporter